MLECLRLFNTLNRTDFSLCVAKFFTSLLDYLPRGKSDFNDQGVILNVKAKLYYL